MNGAHGASGQKRRRWRDRPRASARTIARLLTIGRDQLSKAQTITVAAIERGVAALVEARDILAEFQGIIRRKALTELDAWLDRAARSLIAAFANGIVKDKTRSRPRSSLRGQTVRPRVRSASSSSSNARCMGAGKSTYFEARVIGMN